MQDVVLNSIATGVYVLTAESEGKANGTTVAWVTPVSFDPLLVMVSLANVRFSYDLVKKSGYFGINALTKDKVETARHFGFQTARDTDKMSGQSYTSTDNGVPVLDEASAFIECRVVDSFPAGDHTMFVGEVVDARAVRGGETIIFKQGDFF